MLNSRALVRAIVVVTIALVFVSCGSDSPPRLASQIEADRMGLPALYLTVKSGRQVIGTVNDGPAILDPETGEIAYLALVCENPDCPGRAPHLFIWEDPLYYIQADGTLGYELGDRVELTLAKGGALDPACPACLKIRDLENETPQQRQQYIDWCLEYVLPETAAARNRLDQEHQAGLKQMQQRRQRKISP